MKIRQASDVGHTALLLITVSSWALGIVLSDHADLDGAAAFAQACRAGLEGIVSRQLSAPLPRGAVPSPRVGGV
jgi:hypothetical protein